MREPCNYPLCRLDATLVPVVELPTIRTKGMSDEMVKTNKSTYLIFIPVCVEHSKTYVLANWMNPNDWKYVQEAARANGYTIQDIDIIKVEFKPLGWTPNQSLELERHYGSTSVN